MFVEKFNDYSFCMVNRMVFVAQTCLSEHIAQYAPTSSITPEMLLPSTADTLSTMNGNMLEEVNNTTQISVTF